MQKIVFIGIDDTDILGSMGTGRFARGLADYLESLNMGRSRGVIRHQLLVDPRIPYTSHNSSKCVLFETDRQPAELQKPCTEYFRQHFQPGSDPGLCIATKEQFTDELLAYGRLAQKEYIPKQKAINLADDSGILLDELGGTGGGIIGALAAAALSAGGNDGRYVQLRGIKEIQGLITAAQVKERTDTASIVDEEGHSIPDTEVIDSLGWLRPSRIGGQPVLRVRKETDINGKTTWQPIERKLRSHTG
jgi:hypothetical protein